MSGSVVRSVRVGGSCGEWVPVVTDSLRSNGFYDVSVDMPSLRLSGAYPGGSVSVALCPSDDGLESLISVSVVPYSRGGVAPC